METIAVSRPYLEAGSYDRWMEEHAAPLSVLDRRLARAVRLYVREKLQVGDRSGARHRLAELTQRHPDWMQGHADFIRPLAALAEAVPDEKGAAKPELPSADVLDIVSAARRALRANDLQRAKYLLKGLKDEHPLWWAAHQQWAEKAKQELLAGLFNAFEGKKRPVSLGEARRLSEYFQAAGRGGNILYGFEHPAKQKPMSAMCTIMSLYNAFRRSGRLESASLAAFTRFVRELLGDQRLGKEYGLSTYRVQKICEHLGLPLRVVEMQHRLRHPFRESELLEELHRGQVVVPVFTIGWKDDGSELEPVEHKGFLSDAYYSAAEGRWIYLMMDPLAGRVSFYDFDEMKLFLHKLFIIGSEGGLYLR